MATNREIPLEKLAERRAARKNKKLREECPLFAEFFSTTPEEELERIKRQREIAEDYLSDLRAKSAQAYERGCAHRAAFAALFPEQLPEMEQKWKRRYPRADPREEGHKWADFWWSALRGTAYAAEHCPNRHRHKKADWPPAYNYLLQKFVVVTHCPTCGCPLED